MKNLVSNHRLALVAFLVIASLLLVSGVAASRRNNSADASSNSITEVGIVANSSFREKQLATSPFNQQQLQIKDASLATLSTMTGRGRQFALTSALRNAPLATVSIAGSVFNCSVTPAAGIANVTITLSGDADATTSTDSSGAYLFSNLLAGGFDWAPSKTNSPGAAGVDGADVIGIRRHALGTVLLTGCSLQAADANTDTFVDAADVIATRRFALGLLTGTGNVGQAVFTPTSYSNLNVQTDLSNQDFNAFVRGDVNGDLTQGPAEGRPTKPSSPTQSPAAPQVVTSVNLPVASVSTTVTNFTLPVTTTNIPLSDNLIGFQGDFTFDPNIITFQSPAVTKSGLTAGAIWNVQASLCPPGTTCTSSTQTLRVIGDSDGSVPLSGAGTLFLLNFTRVSSTVGANTALTWQPQLTVNEFRFIDGDLNRQRPTSTPAGSITISAAPTAADGVVVGRVTDSNGNPVSGAVVRLTGTQNRKGITDANGNYRFERVETNGFYTVTPTRANFTFSPSLRSFSQLGERTEAVFAGTFSGDGVNPLDTTEYFVRQQYLDVLGREPDEGGFNYWSDQILACGNDADCITARRRAVAAAFFIETEFQRTGFVVYRMHRASFGTLPGAATRANISYTQFTADRALLPEGADVVQSTASFADGFVSRPQFLNVFPATQTNAEFVNKLFDTAGLSPNTAERQQQIDAMNRGKTRAQVLLDVIEIQEFRTREYNRAFVLMEYFGYLQRDPDQGGYDFWLDVLNSRVVNGYHPMVCAFITSREYQQRFSNVALRSNAECGP